MNKPTHYQRLILAVALVLVACIGTPCLFPIESKPSDIRLIRAFGGEAIYEWSGSDIGETMFAWTGIGFGNARYIIVHLHNDKMIDEEFKKLQLDWNEELSLKCPRLSIDSAKHIKKNCVQLKELNLFAMPQVNGKWIGELITLVHLEGLGISGTSISDDAVDGILKLRNLQSINASFCHITDQGIIALLSLPMLRQVYVSPNQFTPQLQTASLRYRRVRISVVDSPATPGW